MSLEQGSVGTLERAPWGSEPRTMTPVGNPYVFDRRPKLVYWETTRACDLACIHCRAEAVSRRDPRELDNEEALRLIDQIVDFGGPLPHLVLTGGDPLRRPDLYEILRYAAQRGVPVSVTPAGTVALTPEAVRRMKRAGVVSLGLSLDGSDAARHDAFRQVEGSYYWTARAVRTAAEEQLPVQVNTMVTAQTLQDLPAVYESLLELRPARWALFFLIATGRGASLNEIDAAEAERLLGWVVRLSGEAPFVMKTTEAHHVRRIAYAQLRALGRSSAEILASPLARPFGIRDGNGIVFVSHTGRVYPAGFLPVAAGDVREGSLVDIYRDSLLFRQLRDASALKGKCGACEYRRICGGSRARAFAATGDVMGEDWLCAYQPKGGPEVGLTL